MKMNITTKYADSKGRITLGKGFANRVIQIEELENGVILRPCRVIPEDESWLYDNKNALASVRNGLKQARAGELVDGPDLTQSKSLADELLDD
jgi:hypothetical protein